MTYRVRPFLILALLPAGVCAPCLAGAAPAQAGTAAAASLCVVLAACCAVLFGHRRSLHARLAFERHMREIAESALSQVNAQLRELKSEHDRVRENERRRIARDIHDDLGQTLLALKMQLSALHAGAGANSAAFIQRRDAMARSLDLAVRSLRAIIKDLRPAALETGLEKAMTVQLAEFSTTSGVKHELDIEGAPFEAAGEHDMVVFRVLQEALSNVARHASATLVKVRLRRGADQMTLSISDNGVGCILASDDGHGVRGMRERATAAGGRLELHSEPGAGSSVTLSLPLSAGSLAH
jgi:signal transduction histidine kinase